MAADRTPPSRAECLEGLAREAPALIAALESRGWDVPDGDGWTGKDHLAHVVAWQRRLLSWFAEDAAGRRPERPEHGFTFDQIDELNARDHAAAHDRPLTAVRAEFEDAHRAIVALVESMTDADLLATDRFDWLGFPAGHTVAGNSYGHYREHAEMVGAR